MTEAPSRDEEASEPPSIPLLEPRDGTPDPVETTEDLERTAAAFAAGTGPVAVDAERASGYRYGQRAYLVQLRRVGAGTALIDPACCPDLTIVDEALADAEWVLHAASQDLPCLAEIGMRPRRLFDTELAGRLASFDRVGLGTMVEQVLGYRLEKGHSASDWSTRPLPRAWLTYAALDVELLIELRDALEVELAGQGKLGWAREEFAALVNASPPVTRPEPWRRTSGIHRVRAPRALAVVRELWETRDAIAQSDNIAPGRILPDSAIVAAALANPASEEALLQVPVFGGRANRRLVSRWYEAIESARGLPHADLPATRAESDGPPPAHRWREREPAASLRLVAAKEAVSSVAEEHNLPAENLISPDLVRRLAWAPPDPLTPDAVAETLRTGGARSWQIGLTATLLTTAMSASDGADATP
ncbi:MAG: ribonuclease D [Mycobacteriales bacterium]